MKNYCLILAYDGTDYFGWQESPDHQTIEGALRAALEKLVGHCLTLQAASRTDRGVHAKGQVVNFFTHKTPSLYAINALLPPSIRALSLEEKAPSFHPTLDVTGKEYLYLIERSPIQSPFDRHYAWHLYGDFDLKAARKAASLLVGEHDFTAFCNTREEYEDPIRHLKRFEIHEEGTKLLFRLEGNHFLYKMARNLVGTVADVGKGKISLKKIEPILHAKKRREAGICAPAYGLVLNQVFYI